MNEITIKIDTEYIKLQALLKLAGIVNTGALAKHIILEGKVRLNGETVFERGKKVKSGMVVICEYDEHYKITIS